MLVFPVSGEGCRCGWICSIISPSTRKTMRISTTIFILLSLVCQGNRKTITEESGFFEKGVIQAADRGNFAINAYPVIARLPNDDLLCVWSASARGDADSLRIVASISKDHGRTWGKPEVLFESPNARDADPNIVIDGRRILVFSTTVPLPARIEKTQIWMRESRDMGRSWSEPVPISMPRRYVAGKIHIGHKLADGTLIMGYAYDTWAEQGLIPTTEGEMDIKSGVLRSQDGGKTWVPGGDLYVSCIPKITPRSVSGLDEPATVVLKNGEIFALLRSAGTRLYQSRSSDGGITWANPELSPLTSHNAPAALWRLQSPDDEVLVIWNNSPRMRTPLSAALSKDGCLTWSPPKTLTAPKATQASYPSATQAADGALIAVWQEDLPEGGGREIRIARFNRAWLLAQ